MYFGCFLHTKQHVMKSQVAQHLNIDQCVKQTNNAFACSVLL